MIRKIAVLGFVIATMCIDAAAQYMQAIPPDKPGNEQARMEVMQKWLNDWANLSRYGEADKKLGPAAPGEKRVVFMGDSITDIWDLAKYFPDKPYVDRGISGQTTPQMLVRFHPDVVELKPAVVVILGGTNDIAGNTGPMTTEQIEGNIASMADIARAEGIRVVLASVTPIYPAASHMRFYEQRSPEKIRELDGWIQSYCERTGCTYLDYYSKLVDKNGELRHELSDDGLHPNASGFALMAPLAEAAIERAVASRRAPVARH
ncbi:MAG: SGNH/GDSL hydrolase family protein [Terriglobales bacterium]